MDARVVVKLDAAFEATLAVVLLAGAATGALDAGDFPHPVGIAVIVLVGVLLAVAAFAIWRGRIALKLLAADGFSTAGGWLVCVTAAALAALAAAQLTSAR